MNRFTSIASLLVAAALVAGVLAATSGGAKRTAPGGYATTSGYGTASSTTAADHAGTVVRADTSSLGRVLTDGHGRTLYLFEADQPNLSKLSTAGLSVWPP